ncbi:SusE-like outer membrane protein [Flavobacterium sp. 1]|uniref:SusE domain-containing protein n=1 Tax=Flavobacterium sp. 1 TaxID=2035200 RepID=UPI000C245CB6|nr:SusE domain-containing protein [Flavobacterium sp. 1]PJJ10526.1 SusE-like outer membrane protein [Flavobacterium sp. 1]
MKKIIISLILLTGTLASLVSCSDETLDPVGSVVKNTAVSSPATGTDYILEAKTASNDVFTVKWSSVDFGYVAAVTYQLQIVKSTSTNFDADAKTFDLGSFNEGLEETIHQETLTQRELNSVLLSAGGSPSEKGSYKFRVVASPSGQEVKGTNKLVSKSGEVPFTATPYDTFDEFDKLYVPGNFGGSSTYADWNPANAPKIYSPSNDGKYEGFVWMNVTSPAFKFTDDQTWTNDKGDISDPNTFTTLVHTNGKDIKPTNGAGTYFITVDWLKNTYSIAPRHVGVIGAATPSGWDAATYLNYETNVASPYFRMYTINLALKADAILVRLADDWSVKMGSVSGSKETLVATSANKIKFNGGDMVVPAAGNYKIVLDLRNAANYNLRLIPN